MSTPKREDPVHFRFMTEIAIIDQLASRLFERVMPEGLNMPQFTVLNHFVRLDRPSSPQRLAAAFQVTKGAMTNTLQRLEAKGLVSVAADPGDGRAKIVTITPAGRNARDTAIAALEPILKQLAGAFTAAEIAAALPLLVRMRQYLDAERDAS